MRRHVVGGIALGIACLVFSGWLMFHTFTYDSTRQVMRISDKAWSDFGGHMPLIRSFSYGLNWPPENPLFPGERIRYHFGFYALVGLLERAGVRIDWAVNMPSIMGFAGLLFMVWVLARRMFENSLTAALSVLFFLFNGSLSFWYYFEKQGWSWDAVRGILANSHYPTFGPWDGGNIAAIWNLNIYTNQRHLAPALALALLIIYLINFRKVHPLLLGLCIGAVVFLNQAVFAGLLLVLAGLFWLVRGKKIYFLQTLLFMLPWFGISLLLVNTTSTISFEPGFLARGPLTALNLINFWWENLGLHMLLIPLGFIFAPRRAKILLLALLPVFIVPNLWRLSVDMFNNHKLLNLFMVMGVMFSAYVVSRLAQRKLLLPVAVLLVGALTFSGVIDFFALKNHHPLILPDVYVNADEQFVLENIPPKSVVLNSTWFYHSASLAGRPIYSGYTYFTWSHGYPSYDREKILLAIYRAPTLDQACRLLRQHNIDFVELHDRPENYVEPNLDLWQNQFQSMYYNTDSGIHYYSVSQNCLSGN